MNTHNPKFTKWVRRVSGTLIAAMLAISSTGVANARILFEDDEWFNVESEGIILDQNDNLADGTLSTNTYTMADAACLNGETYTATINGTAVVYTATTADCAGADTADTAAVLQGLTAAINGDYTVGHIVTASYAANTVTVTATVADPANNYTTVAGDTSAAGTLVATGGTLTGGVLGDTVELQFGNDGTDGLISYDPNNQNLTVTTSGDTVDFTDENLRTSGAVEFQGSSEFHIREAAGDPNTVAACTTLDEVILDTVANTMYVCTGIGAAGTATWTNAASAAGTDLQGAYDADASGAHEIVVSAGDGEAVEIRAQANNDDLLQLQNSGATPLINFQDLSGTTIDIDSLIVDWDATGAFNLDSTTNVSIGAADASDFTVASDGAADDLTIEVTGATDSSVVLQSSGTGTDAIDLNTTAGGITVDSATGISLDAVDPSNFTIASDGAADDLTIAVTGATDSSIVLDSAGTGTDAIDLNATAGGVTIDAAGAWSIQGAADSDITTTGTSDISLNAGDDMFFDDAQLTGIVQLSVTDTDWNGTFATDGIIDNINSFALTTNGNGASNVGIEDASTWYTGTEVETALNELEAIIGSTTSTTFDFTENNVATLADNDDIYTALNKIDLQFGDLFSTANGEGASLIGIEDTGNYITSTNVEGAISELGAALFGENYEILTFHPEYPNAVVHADGGANKGTLEAFYSAAEDSGYYNWTTNNGSQQDIDIRFTVYTPEDFTSTGDVLFRYRTGTAVPGSNDVEVIMYNVTDAATCFTDNDNNSANVWATQTITAATINAGCAGLSAGDQIEFQIKLLDDNGAGDFADMAWIDWAYTK